jgi:hypothetical protein
MARARIERVLLGHSGWWIAAFAVISATVILWFPEQQGSVFQERNESRRTAIQICAAGFAVFGFYLHFVRIRHAARGEANVRFLRLAELLGSMRDGDGGAKVPNIETRLCAIYGMSRLGEDSESDYELIAKALARYIRINALDSELTPQIDLLPVPAKANLKLRADIQTAIEVLGSESPHGGVVRPAIDLRGAYLPRLELDRLNLSGADCRNTALMSAVFAGVSLRGVNFEGARLEQASMETAFFSTTTKFEGADLSGAVFYRDGELDEEARGLVPDCFAKANNWDRARFSVPFAAAVRKHHGQKFRPSEDELVVDNP